MKRIILAGGSGLIGQALATHFLNTGWDLVVLTRHPNRVGSPVRDVAWDACAIGPWQQELEGATAVINLTGKSVNCRYHARNRNEILDSRVSSTRALGEAIRRCSKPPRVWLNASTATIYRHAFDRPMDEDGEIGATPEAKDAFSVEVAKRWEGAFDEADTPGTRKIAMRMAMVLSPGKNSVFPVLRRLVRSGLGGKMGSGEQYVSWIHIADLSQAVEWLIAHNSLEGRINLVAPNPVPNHEMMRILRRVCHIPFGLPAASWMLEVGAFFLRTETELIIKSRRVIPRRLLESGFQFRFTSIEQAFRDLSGPGTAGGAHRPNRILSAFFEMP